MKPPSSRSYLATLVGLFGLFSATASAEVALELYGIFHAMGIIVTIDGTDDPDGDAAAKVEYRTGSRPYREGFALSRVSNTRFVGSLFWLEPNTNYHVRVSVEDPDGDPIDGMALEASSTTRAEIVIPPAEVSYYVSPTGSGAECSEKAPCSLIEGLNRAQPREDVILRGGTYYLGEIDVPRSGVAGGPIIIRSYTGESAILDGADPASFLWTPQGGGVYRSSVNVADTRLVCVNGERLYPYQSFSDLQSLYWGISGFYADGTALYIHLEGDGDPNDREVVVSRYNYAFYLERDHVFFLDLTFRHYGKGAYAKAIYMNNASDNLVQGCTFVLNDLGIGIKRDSHRNVIQDNEFYDTVFDWPWDAVKSGSSLETGGVRFYDPTTGRGNIIRRNVFHDYFDGFGVCPSSTAGITNETDVYQNKIYNIGDDGLETDGRCSNVRIWGNQFHDVLMGISLAPVYTGPVYAIRNVIYRTGVGNNDYSGSPFKFNSGYGTSGPMYLFHNTCDAVLPGNNGLYIKAPGTWKLIFARNNIWAGTNYALNNYNTGQPVDLDYNNLWNDSGGDLVRWNSTSYATLSAFTAATGQEPHGLHAEPGFVAAEGGRYALRSRSGLIDAGVLLPGINDGHAGAAPDIGAFEYVSKAMPWLILLLH